MNKTCALEQLQTTTQHQNAPERTQLRCQAQPQIFDDAVTSEWYKLSFTFTTQKSSTDLPGRLGAIGEIFSISEVSESRAYKRQDTLITEQCGRKYLGIKWARYAKRTPIKLSLELLKEKLIDKKISFRSGWKCSMETRTIQSTAPRKITTPMFSGPIMTTALQQM